MNNTETNIKFKLTDLLIKQVIDLIINQDDKSLLNKFNDLHHADIAEILEQLNFDQATYIIKLLESDKTSEVLMELDDDFREQILKSGMGMLTLDGKSTLWHKNGQKMFEGIFNYGILDVKWTRWYEDGRKSVEGNVKDDKIFRKTTWWHKNGQKKYEIIAKKYNKQDGLRTFFWHYGSSDNLYEDSDIEMQFSLQKYEGMWTAWDENGDLRFVRNYKDGECVSEDC